MKVSQVIRPLFGLILLGIVVGFILGAAIGFFILPVNFTNTDIANLRSAQKDDYVTMISAAYALDGNLTDAKERLAKLDADPNNAAKYVADVAQRTIDRNDARNARNLAALAIALGAGTPTLRNYVQSAPTLTPKP